MATPDFAALLRKEERTGLGRLRLAPDETARALKSGREGLTIPTAFEVVSEGLHQVESRTRRACRDAFHKSRLLQRIVPDLERLLGHIDEESDFDGDQALPSGLWDPAVGVVPGGINQADPRPGA